MKTQNSLILSAVVAIALSSGFFAYSQVMESEKASNVQTIQITGFTTFVVYDQYGNVKSYWQSDNLVVNEGIFSASDLIFPDINLNGNATDSKFNVIGIGTGSTAPALGNTGLETPVVGCPPVADPSVEGVTGSGSATITINATFTGASGCVGTFNESILGNSVSGGEILARQLISPGKVVGASDTLVGTWEITVT